MRTTGNVPEWSNLSTRSTFKSDECCNLQTLGSPPFVWRGLWFIQFNPLHGSGSPHFAAILEKTKHGAANEVLIKVDSARNWDLGQT